MIKLVASDIDGTLITEGTHEFPEELGAVIDRLKNLGIMFVAASGRQYKSMYRLFKEKADDVVFVAGNGSYIRCRDYDIKEQRIPKESLEVLIKELRAMQRQGYCFVAESKATAYVETDSEEFKNLLVNGYHYEITQVRDILEECDDVLKISLYHKTEIQAAADKMILEWQGRLKVLRSGTNWVDFMPSGVDKGSAIASIQQVMGIRKEETMVFGDNSNDVGMFAQAKYSFAVENAAKEVQKQAAHLAGGPEKQGVIHLLQQVAEQLEQERKQTELEKR